MAKQILSYEDIAFWEEEIKSHIFVNLDCPTQVSIHTWPGSLLVRVRIPHVDMDYKIPGIIFCSPLFSSRAGQVQLMQTEIASMIEELSSARAGRGPDLRERL